MTEMTLEEARGWLRDRLDDGERCPCCTQRAQIYKRTINAGMAVSLITMYRKGGRDWIHVPTEIGARSREEGKLAYWKLVEESTEPRDDGGRAGWWRVTDVGQEFVLGTLYVPKYARVYDGRCLGLTGPLWGIRDALGKKFDYAELMGWAEET